MLNLRKSIKIVCINLTLIIVGSITIGELYLRLLRPKFPMEAQGESYPERLKKAKKDSSKTNLMTIVVGDSFAHHEIGSDGNFFDTVFSCDNDLQCSYHNLAQSGVGLKFYWNTILSILNSRQNNSYNRIVLSIYFGNDTPFINPSTELNSCSSIHTLDSRMTKNYTDNFILSIKRKFPSLLLIARSIKANLGIGAKDNSQQIISNAAGLRLLRTDSNNQLAEIEKLLNKIDPSIIQAANRSAINPWEISLALANPYFYDSLYNLEGDWSTNSVRCLIDNLTANINAVLNKYGNTEFLVIGIPDKFFWSQVSYETTVKEYQKLGYKFKDRQSNSTNNPLSVLVSNRLSMAGINYLYLPSLIDPKTDISDWFYFRDMHINTKGNRKISQLLKEKMFWSEEKES